MDRMDRTPASDTALLERRRQRIFVAVWSAVVVGVLIAFRAILVPFVLAALLAYVLSPVVRWLTGLSLGGRRMPRWVAVLGLYVVMLSGLGVTITVSAPLIASEARDFVREEVPRLAETVRTHWLPRIHLVRQWLIRTTETVGQGGGTSVIVHSDGEPSADTSGALLDRLRAFGAGHTEDIVRVGGGIVGSIVGGVFEFFITLMLSAYILLTEDRILGFIRSLVSPAQRAAFDELLHRIDRGLAGVVRGQLLICAVNGVLSAIGFAIARLDYWPLLALVAAVFSLVPIFGSILSSIPAVAIGLRQGLGTGVFVLAWIIGIHQVEANLLNPKIMGDAAKIHPVLVVFSLLAGEHFFGILGALLAVPTMSIVQSVFLHWRKYALSYGDPRVAIDSFTPPEPKLQDRKPPDLPDPGGT